MRSALGTPLFGVFVLASSFGQNRPDTSSAHPNLSGTWKLNVERSGPILPRGTEALVLVIDHRDPLIHTSETRTVSGNTTRSDGGTAVIDGQLRVEHPGPEKTIKSSQG